MNQSEPKYYAFEPYIDGPVIIGHEKIAEIHRELRPLHEMHFNEVEAHLLDAPFDPDYSSHCMQEKLSRFVLFTLRVDGALVGYLQYYVFRNPYSQHVRMAKEDALFIKEEARGRGYAKPLIDFAENALRQLGCSVLGISSRGPSGSTDVGQYFERLGYFPVAMYYAKRMKDAYDATEG